MRVPRPAADPAKQRKPPQPARRDVDDDEDIIHAAAVSVLAAASYYSMLTAAAAADAEKTRERILPGDEAYNHEQRRIHYINTIIKEGKDKAMMLAVHMTVAEFLRFESLVAPWMRERRKYVLCNQSTGNKPVDISVSKRERILIFLHKLMCGTSIKASVLTWLRGTCTISSACTEVLDILVTKQLHVVRNLEPANVQALHAHRVLVDDPAAARDARGRAVDRLTIECFAVMMRHGVCAAGDGSHIGVQLPRSIRDLFFGRKGQTTNVLVVCTLKGLVTACLPGAEGRRNDSILLREACKRGLVRIGGGFALFDNGLPLTDDILVPHRGAAAHVALLLDTYVSLPRTPIELFNWIQARLRNIIERVFGGCKNLCAILSRPIQHIDLDVVSQIILACFIVYNLLYKWRGHFGDPVPDDEFARAVDGEPISREEANWLATRATVTAFFDAVSDVDDALRAQIVAAVTSTERASRLVQRNSRRGREAAQLAHDDALAHLRATEYQYESFRVLTEVVSSSAALYFTLPAEDDPRFAAMSAAFERTVPAAYDAITAYNTKDSVWVDWLDRNHAALANDLKAMKPRRAAAVDPDDAAGGVGGGAGADADAADADADVEQDDAAARVLSLEIANAPQHRADITNELWRVGGPIILEDLARRGVPVADDFLEQLFIPR